MINIEIPYWTWIQIKCPKCWYEWFPKSKKKWIKSLEILLYICWIFPWIIYSIRRKSSRICSCPKCWEIYVKEIDGNDALVNNLIKKNKIQNYAFLAAVLFFILAIFLTREYKLLNQNANQNNNTNNIIDQFQNTMNDNSFAMKDHQEGEEKLALSEDENNEIIQLKEIATEEKHETSKKQIPTNEDNSDKIRSIVQWAVDWINKDFREWFTANANFSWAYCVWDCANWIINIDWSAYPYIYNYDNIVAGIASSRAVNLSFWIAAVEKEKNVTINLNIEWKLFVTCSWANTVINCSYWTYLNK